MPNTGLSEPLWTSHAISMYVPAISCAYSGVPGGIRSWGPLQVPESPEALSEPWLGLKEPTSLSRGRPPPGPQGESLSSAHPDLASYCTLGWLAALSWSWACLPLTPSLGRPQGAAPSRSAPNRAGPSTANCVGTKGLCSAPLGCRPCSGQ